MKESNLQSIEKRSKEKTIDKYYFPELDGLRFLAFVLVFFHHHPLFIQIPYLTFLNSYGWVGVDLFFALSSFLFTKLLIIEFQEAKKINIKNFYIRRIFRIWPIYYLFIVFSILYLIVKGSVVSNVGARIVGLFTFTENIQSAFYGYNQIPFTAHLWSLAYEEQFYIFVPFIIIFLIGNTKRKKIIWLISIFILFNIFRLIFIANHTPHPAIYVLPFTHFESIIFGIVIGFGGFQFLLKKLSSLLIGLIGILFFILLCQLPPINNISHWLTLSYTFVGLSTSLVIFSVLNNDFLKKIFSQKIIVFLGKRSYGLYLYHLLSIEVVSYLFTKINLLPTVNLVATFFISMLFTVIISIISYKLIETPFLKLKQKYGIINSRPI
jgi:peptidoglycan/LPS O-acetylase OafA/YrhL